jgi:glucose/arabinose dehydrogenase
MPRRLSAALAAVALALLFAPVAAGAAPLSLVSVGSFAQPTYVTAAPGDPSRLYVVERRGTIKVLRDGSAQTFADLTGLVSALEGERGLLSIAFAPDFATSRRFYAYFTGKPPLVRTEGDVVIARFVATDADRAGAAPEVLVAIPHGRASNHNGGQLQFGPDGLLYAGTGDGGVGDDPAGNGQNLDSATPVEIKDVDHHPLLGKLLRLDVSPATGYAVPPANAFGPATKAPEIFAYGLRNPYRFSFDAATGDLILGDVGQGAREEVDFLRGGGPAGANFGWSRFEGTRGSGDRAGVTFPVLEYGHSAGSFGNTSGCSVIGGYVVRDPQVPELAGQYVYGDFCAAKLRAARLTANGSTDDRDLSLPQLKDSIIAFGEDACGRLHVATNDGLVQRLVSGGGECVVPRGAPGTPAVSAGPPPPARRASVLTVRGTTAQRVIAAGRLRLTLSCDVLCDVRARGLFLLGRQRPGTRPRLVLRQRRDRLGARARVRIDLRASAATRRTVARALRRGRTVTARVVLRVAVPGGAPRTRVVRVRVRR